VREVRCHFCGERVSRGDETCWNCGIMLRYEEPRGTLQEEMQRKYEPNEWVSRNLKTILAIGIALGIILATLGAIFLFQEMNRSATSGNLSITDYIYGEVDDSVWFAIYIKNDGISFDSRTVIAEVITPSGTYTNSVKVGADAGAVASGYILVELPPGENQGNYQTDCYLSLF
jgi:hypothetical protein